MVFRRILAQLIFLIAASSLAAQTEKTLVNKGAWRVSEIISNVEGDSNPCYAETTSGQHQTFLFEAQGGDHLSISIWDNRWELPLTPISFVIAIDGSKWPVDGNSNGGNVAYYFDNKIRAQTFMKEMSAGNNVTVLNKSGKRIATFSLSGSSVALSAFNDCWARAQKVGQAASDPFGVNANAAQYGDTLKDTNGNIFLIAQAPEGSGTILESTNMSETEHESFGMYNDCRTFSFRHGYGTWASETVGFKINFDGVGFRFPDKAVPIEQNSC